MRNIRLIDRPMTDAEFFRRCAAGNAYARERGVPVLTREQHDIVVLDGDAFVGCATGYVYTDGATHNGWMYLYNLYLEKPYRKRGLGALLLRTLENRVAVLGVMQVWTHTVSYEAPGFYQKQGYRIFHVREQRHTTAHHEVFLRKHVPTHAAETAPGRHETIRMLERPITEAELAQVNAGFDVHTREQECPVQTFTRPGVMALDGDTVIGGISGIARYDGAQVNRWFFMTDLFVEAGYRRQGIGTALLHRMEAQIAALGAWSISTEIAGYEAVEFFQQHGYAVAYAFEDWYPGGYSRISMEKCCREEST